jgi:hypothetical protein
MASLRGLNTKGNAKELREQAGDYRQFGGPVTVVQDTLVALDSMMSWLMVEHIEDNSYYTEIHIFLSLYADMDARLTKLDGRSSYQAGRHSDVADPSQFLSLLNLPDTIRKFGPIRNLWEGFWMGEGI